VIDDGSAPAMLGLAGAVVGLYAYAAFSLVDGDWLRALVAAGVATIPAAGLAVAWLRA
jgi:hypothetical protein